MFNESAKLIGGPIAASMTPLPMGAGEGPASQKLF
jgi:hypothetical protein